MERRDLPVEVLGRQAIVYVRQSSMAQMAENLESQRRQYELVELARDYGFREVVTIDDDLGRSASGLAERPGFQRLVAALCSGSVGAVLCLEASRLARNGHDWHHLLELCGLVGAYVIDPEGAHDPCLPNDRLLLGLKGSISEFELSVLRGRLTEALKSKARRGELRLPVPVGFVWPRGEPVQLDPDRRVQEVIRLIFRKFEELGSGRRVLLWMRREGVQFPCPADGKHSSRLVWRPPVYRHVISVLTNPFYAGAYAFGKSSVRVEVHNGRGRKRYGLQKPRSEWEVFLPEHHPGYIDGADHERILGRLAENAYMKPSGTRKSGRGGRGLLAGLLRCRRCGRMLQVAYAGHKTRLLRYTCKGGNVNQGTPPCISFGGLCADALITAEVLKVVQPLAVESALQAVGLEQAREAEHLRTIQLELEQARYEADLAGRRYEAVDPANRLVADTLETRWNVALERVREVEERLTAIQSAPPEHIAEDDLLDLARDLDATWNDPATDMHLKQRIVRTLVEEVRS